ncbi:MAG: hypothetical protein C0404_03450 [Verrucomicrobia bacterium]|nr:hypothetical protein [Verrucomicrobiota bacterium]
MTSDQRQLLLKTIEGVVSGFMTDFRKAPLLWAQEIDLQASLATKIRASIETLEQGDFFSVHAPHSHFAKGKKPLYFCRTVCEPYVSIASEPAPMHPDIVVWDDGNDNGGICLNSGLWPILWACEIKYSYARPGERNDDRLRLQRLAQDADLMPNGRVCCLEFCLDVNTRKGEVHCWSPAPQR